MDAHCGMSKREKILLETTLYPSLVWDMGLAAELQEINTL